MSVKLHKNTPAAYYIGVTPGTLNTWRSQGKGPKHIKVGALVRYSEADLDAWLAERTRTSTSHHTQLSLAAA